MNAPQPRGWIHTFTGRQFWPLAPRAIDVNIVDIAHALGMKCRYGGHSREFYSVAEHCCHVSDQLRQALKFEGLMHDSPETYSPFGDVPRPVKQQLPIVDEIEGAIYVVIAERYDLPAVESCEVKHIDMRICVDEKAQLMTNHSFADPSLPGDLKPLGLTVQCWSPEHAKQEFLRRFERLCGDHYAQAARARMSA